MGMISKKVGGASALGFALGAVLLAQPVASAPVTFDFAKLAQNGGASGAEALDLTPLILTGQPPVIGQPEPRTYFVLSRMASALPVRLSNSGSRLPMHIWMHRAVGRVVSACVLVSMQTIQTQCAPTSDDNTGVAGDGDETASSGLETLKLSFVNGGGAQQAVSITSITFYDRDHQIHTNDFLVGLKVDGEAQNNWTVGNSIKAGTMFEFIRLAAGNYDGKEKGKDELDFYLSIAEVSAVPLPAGILLLGSALGGLGLMGRRRKTA